MNWLDRVVSAVSPQRGLERVRARALTERVVRAYAAGQPAPRGKDWMASARGPNAEVGPALRYLRRRSREVIRDGSYGARAVQIRVAHEIGYGISPRSKTGDLELDAKVLALWERWGTKADLHGRLDIYGLQALAARTRVEAGEALIRMVRMPPNRARQDGLAVPLQLEIIEPDLLDDVAPIFAPATPEPGRVVDGVVFDAQGRRTGYRLLRQHPGETGFAYYTAVGPRFDTVPVAEMIHLVRAHAQRPGQVRGVPDAATILLRLRRLEEFEEATLEQAKVQALLGVFTTTANPMEMDIGSEAPPTDVADRAIPADLWPGMVANLPIGSDVKFLQPSGPGPFEPFALHELMAIASGFRVTYDQLTGDLRQANYSSLRAGKIEFRKDVEQDQWLMHIPMMCQPIWEAFIQAAILFGALPERAGGYPVEWAPPRAEMVDPTREIPALVASVRSGLETWQQAVTSMGYDPRRQAEEIAAANKLHDDLGIILDSDPRRITNSGGAQSPQQNAAVEIAATGAAIPRPGEIPSDAQD
ncbi:phage portal protein [Roseomonas nepalensis]|uniref:Phage portal protein n=1 Tax=Muricoccus nepalensis TaxID=1854500 RepID=A0A502FVH6_9PROT|nr:phage portal protein [Roseomonas nepalensis]TPG53262.1 phage portal protein [Roseomonas nepalensis]